jgi:hypothetical protein
MRAEHADNWSVSIKRHKKITKCSMQQNKLFDISGVQINDEFINKIYQCKQEERNHSVFFATQ